MKTRYITYIKDEDEDNTIPAVGYGRQSFLTIDKKGAEKKTNHRNDLLTTCQNNNNEKSIKTRYYQRWIKSATNFKINRKKDVELVGTSKMKDNSGPVEEVWEVKVKIKTKRGRPRNQWKDETTKIVTERGKTISEKQKKCRQSLYVVKKYHVLRWNVDYINHRNT